MPENDIAVRLVGADESALFNFVHEDVFDAAIRPDSLAQFLADPRHVIAVAMATASGENGQIIGMCSAVECFHPDKPPHMFLNEIGVAGPYRRQGVGRRLVAAIQDAARQRGCANLWVGTETDNFAAQGLFQSVGEAKTAQPFLLYEWDWEDDR